MEGGASKGDAEIDATEQREPEQEEEGQDNGIPALIDSSGDEVKPVEAENWIDGVDEED